MTVSLDLPPQVEQAYLAEAEARGLPLAEVVREVLVAAHPSAMTRERTTEEWVREFETWVESHSGNTMVLPDAAMERESIYEDRGGDHRL
jgi:hypothetical protein